MAEFESKVRNVGTSYGVIIPKEVIKKLRIRKGQRIKILIQEKKNVEDVWKYFGIDKGAKPFKREHGTDREF